MIVFYFIFCIKFEIKNIKFICDYDKNIRGGLKIDIGAILRDGKFEKLVSSDKVSEAEIEEIIK